MGQTKQQQIDLWFWALIKLLIALLVCVGVIYSTLWLETSKAIDVRTGTGFVLLFLAVALMVSLFFNFKPRN
jgi:hypothetical protein